MKEIGDAGGCIKETRKPITLYLAILYGFKSIRPQNVGAKIAVCELGGQTFSGKPLVAAGLRGQQPALSVMDGADNKDNKALITGQHGRSSQGISHGLSSLGVCGAHVIDLWLEDVGKDDFLQGYLGARQDGGNSDQGPLVRRGSGVVSGLAGPGQVDAL